MLTKTAPRGPGVLTTLAAVPTHCEQCGEALPKRKRSRQQLCRVCATRASYSFLAHVLQDRRRHHA